MTLQERVHKAKPKESWPLNKLHHVLTVRGNNKNIGMINDNLLSLSYGRIVNKNIDSAEGLLPESFETYQIVQPGDIVMRLTDLQNDKRSIRQGLVKEQGIITSAYDAVYPKKDHDSRFWAYALLALDLAKYYYSLGGGVRQSIKFKDFPNDWIYTPPTETQKEIADFLDRETARIDLLIAKKHRFLELIQLQTKSKNRELFSGSHIRGSKKLSFYNWVGRIPNEWDEFKISWIFSKIGSGTTPLSNNSSYYTDEGGINWVNTGDLREKIINGTKNQITHSALEEHSTLKIYKPGTLLVAMYGATIGRTGILGVEACCNQACCALELPISKVSTEYIFHWFNTYRDEIIQLASGGGQPNINQDKVKNLRVALPDKRETQDEILSMVNLAYQKKSSLLDKTNATIEFLKEFRASLITEAVTGQLDIKAWKNKGGTDKRLDNIAEAMAS